MKKKDFPPKPPSAMHTTPAFLSPQTPPETPLIEATTYIIDAMKKTMEDDIAKQKWYWKMYWEYRRMNEEGLEIIKSLEASLCELKKKYKM